MSTSSALLKGSGSANFSGMWPRMQPVVLKLLKQERVSRDEWQDLFWWASTQWPLCISSYTHTYIHTYIHTYTQVFWAYRYYNIASLFYTPSSLSHILHTQSPSPSHFTHRDVHTVCSWDEKAAQKIQRALEEEILRFTKDVQSVNTRAWSYAANTLLLFLFSFSLFLLLLLFLLYFLIHLFHLLLVLLPSSSSCSSSSLSSFLFSYLPPSPPPLPHLSVYYNIRKRVRCSRRIFWSGASSLLSVHTYPNRFKR